MRPNLTRHIFQTILGGRSYDFISHACTGFAYRLCWFYSRGEERFCLRGAEERNQPPRLVGMNSAISYMSAAQLHADAIREGYRNPRPRLEEPKVAQTVRANRPRRLRALILART